MVALVVGGAGFIASHIVDKLIDLGHRTVVVDNLSTGKLEHINSKAVFYNMDITDDELKQIFSKERPDIVYHLAAQIDIQTSLKNPVFDAKVNILGTVNVLECCRMYDVDKIVYASSAAVYGDPEYLGVDEQHRVNPMSFYGISKHTPEHYIKVYHDLYGLKYTILRYANVYGIRQDPKGEGGVVSIFVDKLLKRQQPFIYGDGEQTRDFIYVDDIAQANISAIDLGHNQIINIGTGISTSINTLFDTMNKITGADVKPIYENARKGDIRDSYFNIQKAGNFLNWQPAYSLEDGLRKTIEYYSLKYYGK